MPAYIKRNDIYYIILLSVKKINTFLENILERASLLIFSYLFTFYQGYDIIKIGKGNRLLPYT